MIVKTEDELMEALELPLVRKELKLILGGGSNLLPTKDIDGLVLKVDIRGKEEIPGKDQNNVWVRSKAGENWHQLVLWTLQNGWGGLENLSLIPGNVGTAPIQNIGAYGVELKDVMVQCNGFYLDGTPATFSNEECQFGYRDSIFKNDLKGKFIITGVDFKLTRKNHLLNTSYGAIRTELEQMGISEPTPLDVSRAVIRIRKSKLPDPALVGNAGSFFKNPVIEDREIDEIKSTYPDLVSYPVGNGRSKVAAGWLIEKAGWKGKDLGGYGVNPNQALVLVNYGGATGPQMWGLALEIIQDIQSKFGIQLEPEVNIL